MPVARCPTCNLYIPTPDMRNHLRKHRGKQANGRNGGSRQWRKLRGAVLRRDDHMCAKCGRSQFELPKALQVHHINEDWRDDRMENLISVCEECHPL